MFLLDLNHCSTSFPAKYLRLGFSSLIALSTTFATSSGEDPFFTTFPEPVAIFCIICKYGEFGSWDFFAMTKPLPKFVLITPGSTITTFIPNGSNSYDIGSLSPSTANFVLTYADPLGKPNLPAPELIFTMVPDFCLLIVGRTA